MIKKRKMNCKFCQRYFSGFFLLLFHSIFPFSFCYLLTDFCSVFFYLLHLPLFNWRFRWVRVGFSFYFFSLLLLPSLFVFCQTKKHSFFVLLFIILFRFSCSTFVFLIFLVLHTALGLHSHLKMYLRFFRFSENAIYAGLR